MTDENGQLVPANYDIPKAVDNSGSIAHIRIAPEHFRPPRFITQDIDVMYTAFDHAGNTAECLVQLRIPGNLIYSSNN